MTDDSNCMIRKATQSDIQGIIALLYQADAVHHGIRPDLFKGNTPKYDEQELAAIIDDATKPIFVYDDGNISGHAFCQIVEIRNHRLMQDIKTLYIDDICVDEAARGKHVGTTIYPHVINFARTEDFYNVTLNVWSCNEGAMRFYEKMGMTPQKIGMEIVL